MPLRKFRLSEVIDETPEIKTFRFEPADRRPFKFRAGQFVVLRIGDEQRSYSISSPASETRYIDLTIRIGPESYFPKKIGKLKIGDIVSIDGPHGLFTLEPKAKGIVFIGAGVGIAGLRSLLTEALQKGVTDITVLYSARVEKEILWRKFFDKLKGVKIVYTLTREHPKNWLGELGRIDAAMISRAVPDFRDKYYYICGPVDMVESVCAALASAGVPDAQIRAESWGGIVGSV